eukprot:GHVR01054761.1.p1 GENE.GHVR01054761.1~~GHVR01054761.1.p1  ORF type:complete len:136 (+),score=29.55 GHVR01054761.1:66-473(+)
MHRQTLSLSTKGRDITCITKDINNVLVQSKKKDGLLHLFICHTSASLILCENTDPDVLYDLETFTKGLIVDGDKRFRHTDEGPDDMPAHIRSVFTHTDITIPFENGRMMLGTWQGVFLWEHRMQPHRRKIIVTIM